MHKEIPYFGVYQSSKNNAGYHISIEDNSNKHDSDFWMPMSTPGGRLIGHLHFKKIGPELFELDRIRPVLCPIHNQSEICTQISCSQPEDA